MAVCPCCAAETPGGAIHCRACRNDLAAPPPRRTGRSRLAGAAALFALVVAAVPVIARPLLQRWRAERCEPTNLSEWHAAMRRRCLTPAYVCEHMTTPEMLEDPDIARAIGGEAHGGLSELVDRMRAAYGCSPEQDIPLEPGVVVPPSLPALQDRPRTL